MTKTSTGYSPEVRERAVRLVLDHQKDHPSQWAAIESIAPKIGCSSETWCKWVRCSERDAGQQPGLTSDNHFAAHLLTKADDVVTIDCQDWTRIYCHARAERFEDPASPRRNADVWKRGLTMDKRHAVA